MIIQKFNESKIHKKWTDDKIHKHLQDKEYLCDILEKYLFWKTGDDPEENVYGVFNFYFESIGNFIIEYYDGDNDNESYPVVSYEYDELIEFINNPDMFLNAKKYNL